MLNLSDDKYVPWMKTKEAFNAFQEFLLRTHLKKKKQNSFREYVILLMEASLQPSCR